MKALYNPKSNIVKKSIKILFIIIATVFVGEVQAQGRKVIYLQNYDKAPYHFGFLLGANFMDYNLIMTENYHDTVYTDYNLLPSSIGDNDFGLTVSEGNFQSFQIMGVERDTLNRLLKSSPRVGFSVGVVGDLRLSEHFNLRFSPTFSLSEINYRYKLKINQTDGKEYETPASHNPYLSCLEFPLHVKYRSKRYNNVAAYLFGGFSPKLYFSFKKKNQDFNWLKNKAWDLALELGSGFDIYNQWFKMGVEAKFCFGLFNALSDDQVYFYALPLKGMKNKQFQISLTFE